MAKFKSSPLFKAIVGFPGYAVAYVLGFYLILTEIELTTLAIVGVLIGLQTHSIEIGVSVFLGGWLLFRLIIVSRRANG